MKLNFDELENGMLSECAVFCEEEEKMESMLSFDWSSVSVNSGEVIALMRKHRNDKLDVLFHYADGIYRVGVDPENVREPFYMDDETYPSMFAFCSSACIEGGFLLPDLQAPLHILAVNGGDPAEFFA